MYLATAAVLGTGLLGISNHRKLKWKDCRESAGAMDDERRAGFGIDTQLPKSMKEALVILGDGSGLEAVLGKELLREYVSRKEEEEVFMSKVTEDERRAFALPFF
jgi:glutamine synthetase